MNRVFWMVLFALVSNSNSVIADTVSTRLNPEYGENGGLIWAYWKDTKGSNASFGAKEAYCRTNIGGVPGWRLPTMAEAISVYAKNSDKKYYETHWQLAADIISSEVGDAIEEPSHKGIRVGLIGNFPDSDTGVPDFSCVHDTLVSDIKFRKTHKINTRTEWAKKNAPPKKLSPTDGDQKSTPQ